MKALKECLILALLVAVLSALILSIDATSREAGRREVEQEAIDSGHALRITTPDGQLIFEWK